MRKPYPCGGLGRRQFLASTVALPALAALHVSAAEPNAATDSKALVGKLGIPGPYPGRVIEVRNPALSKDGVKNRSAIKADRCPGHEGTDRRRRIRSRPGAPSSSRATWSASR